MTIGPSEFGAHFVSGRLGARGDMARIPGLRLTGDHVAVKQP